VYSIQFCAGRGSMKSSDCQKRFLGMAEETDVKEFRWVLFCSEIYAVSVFDSVIFNNLFIYLYYFLSANLRPKILQTFEKIEKEDITEIHALC